jgi:hypothetical protein
MIMASRGQPTRRKGGTDARHFHQLHRQRPRLGVLDAKELEAHGRAPHVHEWETPSNHVFDNLDSIREAKAQQANALIAAETIEG